jgi:dTDP-glucose 4,6-dehydratase
VTQIARNKSAIKLGALNPTRDFGFVKDTARGFIAAAKAENIEGEVINLGSNFEITILETVELIADIMNAKPVIESEEMRARPLESEVERLWSDNAKAKELLGWEPEFGGLDGFRKGLGKTIQWFMNPGNLNKYKVDQYVV